MKEFRLSTRNERIVSLAFIAVILVSFGILLFALRKNIGLLIVCGFGIVFLSVFLILYIRNVLKATCFVNAAEKKLEVKGYPDRTIDLSNAVMVQTVAKRNGQNASRVLLFTDVHEQVVAVVSTMFTFRGGMYAEPMAKEMAKELGIAFQENIPVWEYDKEAFKVHQKDEALREKLEAKKRREDRGKMRIFKYKKNQK